MVTILDEDGVPSPVVWTRLVPPRSRIGDAGRAEVDAAAKKSASWSRYATEENRESAEEKLQARLASAAEAAEAESGDLDVRVEKPRSRRRTSSRTSSRKSSRAPQKDDESVVESVLTSREGRSMINTILRGVFGILKKS
jgi:hypothetical protein